MPFKLGPLVSRVSGHFGGRQKYKASLRSDGTLRIGKRRPGLGAPEIANTKMQWGQLVYKYLDWFWGTLSPSQKLEWRRCIPRTRSRHWSNFSYFKHVNALRIFYDMPPIPSPPDRFKSHKVYLKPWDANPASQKYAEHGVWQDGLTKDGTPFDEHSPAPDFPHPAPTCHRKPLPDLPNLCPYGPRKLWAAYYPGIYWPPSAQPWFDWGQFCFSIPEPPWALCDCRWLGGHPMYIKWALREWYFIPHDIELTHVPYPVANRPPGGVWGFSVEVRHRYVFPASWKTYWAYYARPRTSEFPMGSYCLTGVDKWLWEEGLIPGAVFVTTPRPDPVFHTVSEMPFDFWTWFGSCMPHMQL